MNTSSLCSGGVISESSAREVGSNTARQIPFNVFTRKNTHKCCAAEKPKKTQAQPNTEISMTILRPITSEIYPP
ncbi:hypothetical protein D3C87_2059230 [compost metagenome]